MEKGVINSLLGQVARRLERLDFSIAFGVKDTAQHQQQLILQAIAKAKENSALIAGATGVELREILHIDYSFRELVIRSQRHNYPVYDSEVTLEASAPAPDFEPDDIDVTETITITWGIELNTLKHGMPPYGHPIRGDKAITTYLKMALLEITCFTKETIIESFDRIAERLFTDHILRLTLSRLKPGDSCATTPVGAY